MFCSSKPDPKKGKGKDFSVQWREQNGEYRRCLTRMYLRNPHAFFLGLPNAQKQNTRKYDNMK